VSDAQPAARAPEGTPLYVHLPYCAAKCPYCDFFSVARSGNAGFEVESTIDALLAEARLVAPPRPRTVFLGGGTPSFLSARQLARLLDGLDRLTDFRASAEEVTAECNPESLDLQKARNLLDLGVDRLSIGFQSLDEGVLAFFGRVHSAHRALSAFEAARAAGARRVNVDLIYAAPGLSSERWAADLERVLSLQPEHLSAYALTIEEGTAFHRLAQSGKLCSVPDELELEQQAIARELTAAAGLMAYEVSNYSLPGEECLHNVNYWENGAYLGLGPSAASKVGATRRGNPRSIETWRAAALAGRPSPAWSETLPPEARLGETWWLGLRMSRGLTPEGARRTAGFETPGPDPALPIAERLTDQGLLERSGDHYRLTRRGLPLADHVGREFLVA
jgi:oxygen-independent coproporphyrinogen-3 oxidase